MAEDLPEALAVALPRVLHDLEVTTGVVLRFEPYAWGLAEQLTAMAWWPDGGGQGIFVMANDDAETSVASLADQIQELVVENKVAIDGSSTWPECPQHPRSHPMAATVVGGVASWTCPLNSQPETRVGSLVTVARGKLTARQKRDLKRRSGT